MALDILEFVNEANPLGPPADPNTATPINAENLELMQTRIGEYIDLKALANGARSIHEVGVKPENSAGVNQTNMNALIDAINQGVTDFEGGPANTVWMIPPGHIGGTLFPYQFEATFDRLTASYFVFLGASRGFSTLKATGGHDGNFFDIGDPLHDNVTLTNFWGIRHLGFDCSSITPGADDNVFELTGGTRRWSIEHIRFNQTGGWVTVGGKNEAVGTLTAGIDADDTTLSVTSTLIHNDFGGGPVATDPFGNGRTENWILTCESEQMRVISIEETATDVYELVVKRGVGGTTAVAHAVNTSWSIPSAGKEFNAAEGALRDLKGTYRGNIGCKTLHMRLCSGNNDFQNIKGGPQQPGHTGANSGVGILFESWRRSPGGLEDTQLQNVSLWGGFYDNGNVGVLTNVKFDFTHGDIHNCWLDRCDWDFAGQWDGSLYQGASVQVVSGTGRVTNDQGTADTPAGTWADYDVRGIYLEHPFFGSNLTARGATVSNQGKGHCKDVKYNHLHTAMRQNRVFESFANSGGGGTVFGIQITHPEVRVTDETTHESVFRFNHHDGLAGGPGGTPQGGGDFILSMPDVRLWNAEDGDPDVDYLVDIAATGADDYAVIAPIAPGLNIQTPDATHETAGIKHPSSGYAIYQSQRRVILYPAAAVAQIASPASGDLKIPPGVRFVVLTGTNTIDSIEGDKGDVLIKVGGAINFTAKADPDGIHLDGVAAGANLGLTANDVLHLASHTGGTWYQAAKVPNNT